MKRKAVSGIILVLMLISVSTSAYNIQFGKADWIWTETIYIRNDGSVYPNTAPISTIDNVTYTLTDNIVGDIPEASNAIVVERNNTVIDGNGHVLQGTGAWASKGIDLTGRSNVTVKSMEITRFFFGIYLYYSLNNSISGNNVTANGYYGIHLGSYSNCNNITGNQITNNFHGLVLSQPSSNNTISGNTITNNTYNGIELYDSSNNSMVGNTVTNNQYGIWLHHYSDCNYITKNIIANNSEGIRLSESVCYNRISGNNMSENSFGIVLVAFAENNLVYHNNFIGNTQHVECTFLNIWDNDYPSGGNYWSNYTGVDADNDGIGDTPHIIDADNQDNYPLIHPWDILNPVHNINTGLSYARIQEAINSPETLDEHAIFVEVGTYHENVVVNKTLLLTGENKGTTIIDGNGTGDVVCIAANNVRISSFTMQNSGLAEPNYGIYVVPNVNGSVLSNNIVTRSQYAIALGSYSNKNALSNNTVTDSVIGIILQENSTQNVLRDNQVTSHWIAIRLLESSGNSVIGNNITDNMYAIVLHSSSGNYIDGNNITANSQSGIFLDSSSDNSVIGNNIIASYWSGILIGFSPNNSVSGNNIANGHIGIEIWRSSASKFYHNNFINNTIQVTSSGSDVNVWDDDYPSGGNYWSDYTGVDLYHGPYQNETGSDGIGDAPYIIDVDNRDNYPLMKPYGGTVDIGIANLTTSKTVVGQGYNLNVTVKIINYGINSEAFNVTVYANTTTIATFTNITLTSRNSTTITFTWNTTDFVKGNSTISANITQVLGETDTTDNMLIDGAVLVSVPCDVTGPEPGVPDGVCNMRDIGYFCSKFGTTPSNPNWDSNADVTGPTSRVPDGTVNMRDIGEACSNFGKT